jgi:WD40 repeat protein
VARGVVHALEYRSHVQVGGLESGQCLRTLEGHTDIVWSVSVTPDGRRAVSWDFDKALRVWDLESGQCLCLYSTPAPVVSVALDRNGNTLCIGTRGDAVLVLDVEGIEPNPEMKPDAASDIRDDSYEQLLFSGFEFSRREKGHDHEETLAHLAALAVHLKRIGKPDEARAFAEARDRLIAKQPNPAKP